MPKLELDPALNRLPDRLKTVHLIGICGTGMAALAGMLKEKGFIVTGSDANVYPPMSDFLESLGIPVMKGYSPANLDHGPDLVVVGNVVTRQNPESQALKNLGLNYLSFPETLRALIFAAKKTLVVAGTHGKTTTSSLAAWLLESAGQDPGFMIGGILTNFDRNFKLGSGDWFVIEGDEYDTAFFDKVPKFVKYAPRVGILTSVEFDHADIYPNLDAVKQAFTGFVDIIHPDGALIACGDDPLVMEMAPRSKAPVISYGLKESCDWQAVDLKPQGRSTAFSAIGPDGREVRLTSPLPGAHNVINSLAVFVALDFIGISAEKIKSGFSGFKGIKRRQEVRGVMSGVTVIDDFAHHPTAVAGTIKAIREAYPESRLVAVFEPRTNTSRRSVFQAEYAQSFDDADQVHIRQAPDLNKIPEEERFSSTRLVSDLQAKGIEAFYHDDTEPILNQLANELIPGDLVLIMSNGGFDNIHTRLLDRLKDRAGGPS